MNLYKMIEICLKDDNMHIFVMINALICINNHVITCINSMLSISNHREIKDGSGMKFSEPRRTPIEIKMKLNLNWNPKPKIDDTWR